jgi:hypothetical protein
MREVSNDGFNANKVWCCCKGIRIKSGGYHWYFEDDKQWVEKLLHREKETA